MILWCHLIGDKQFWNAQIHVEYFHTSDSAFITLMSFNWFPVETMLKILSIVYLHTTDSAFITLLSFNGFLIETMLKILSIEYFHTSDPHFLSSQPNFFSGQRWPCFQMLQHDYNVQQAIKMQTCDFWFCQNIIFWADLIHNWLFLHQKPEISISDRGRHGSGYQCRHLLERYR